MLGLAPVLGLAAVVVLAYGAVCGFLYTQQRSLLYFPTPRSDAPGAMEVMLSVDNGNSLRLLTRPHEGPRALIYFGGNAEDVAGDFGWLSELLPDCALYLVNYRGYGGSSGAPSEAALFSDALRVYDEVGKTHAQVFVIGRSLGSGVASYLASERPVQRLALVTPFDSIVNVAAAQYPWVPVSLLMRDRYDSASRALQIKASTLVIIAEKDELIPRASSETLFAKLPQNHSARVVVTGVGHNDIGLSREYLGYIGALFRPQILEMP